jgi:ABC-2 type transport system ATP-binding protein
MNVKISIKNMTVKYGNFIAVRNLNLEVREGEILGILGPNGSGKTTTIRAILGLIPFEGTINVDGFPVGSPEAKRKIGWMPQGTPLYSNLSIKENLRFFAKVYRIENAEDRINELLEIVELKRWEDRLVKNLSGGMRRRVMLACSIIHDPEILILDEPTAGVDPMLRKTFWEYFEGFSTEGKALLVTTHYLDEAENCHRLAIMRDGNLIAKGRPDEIKRAVSKDVIVLKAERNAIDVLISLKLNFSVKGNQIIITTSDASTDLPFIIEKLREKNVTVKSSDIRKISLEDAFLELIKDVR